MSNSTVYYAVKSFITTGEHHEVPILCEKIYKKSVTLHIFLPSIKIANLCTFCFYTPQSSFSTDKIIACLDPQPPGVWAGIIINKIIVIKGRNLNLFGCISVVRDTAHHESLVIVCVPCIWHIV